MATAIFWTRRGKQDIETGVYGEQTDEPQSIQHLQSTGVNYIGCHPYRVPIAKLVAAQTAIQARPNGSRAEIPYAETSQGMALTAKYTAGFSCLSPKRGGGYR
ncbi:hypothetical protein ACFLYX_02410 [Chloroflexota bacterium]